jgi:hypothetical protein
MDKNKGWTEIFISDAVASLSEDAFSKNITKVLTPTGNSNTNDRAYEIRKVLENPEAKQCSPLHGLEEIWEVLTEHYGYYSGKPVVSRVENPDLTASSPMENFCFHIDGGFYPPPEVMLTIYMCFEKYLTSGGDTSLDEAFFGKPHKKHESHAGQRSKKSKYFAFHKLYVELRQGHLEATGQPKESLEELAEAYFSSMLYTGDTDIDIDTYLRGYRRWKEGK